MQEMHYLPALRLADELRVALFISCRSCQSEFVVPLCWEACFCILIL